MRSAIICVVVLPVVSFTARLRWLASSDNTYYSFHNHYYGLDSICCVGTKRLQNNTHLCVELKNVIDMDEYKNFDTVSDYNRFHNNDTLHPLVSVVDYSKSEPHGFFNMRLGFYAIILKDVKCGEMKYGRNFYDYDEDTLVFLAPGQAVKFVNTDVTHHPKGYALIFHPDLLRGTNLGKSIQNYSFFNYAVNEALHVSKAERELVLDCLKKIEYELKNALDKHSRQLIVSNIELFLQYCVRFYERQFITREFPNKGVIEEFEKLLNDYYNVSELKDLGLPSVAYFAEQLHLSPNYFGDLVKRETGQSAQDYILSKVIDVAKEKVFDTQKSIKEISYELGFKYPQHFIRLFKTKIGVTPNEYRHLN
jgi:AraC family transcriptional regulator, transcriptional activator of pobA